MTQIFKIGFTQICENRFTQIRVIRGPALL